MTDSDNKAELTFEIGDLTELQGTRVVLSGGGTGGHLYPLLAVADVWSREADGNVLFVGTKVGIEGEVVPQRGYRLAVVSARGLCGGVWGKIKALAALGVGIVQSWRTLRAFRPKVVVGAGGYVCAPVLMAAKLLGIPTLLMEQNARAGKTVRLLARFASRVCTCWPEAASTGLPAEKVVLTGNPIRCEVVEADRDQGRKKLGIAGSRPCVLITGGSQGAASLDKAVVCALNTWKEQDWTVIHITGPKHLEQIQSQALPLVRGGKLDYRAVGYLDDMASAYAASDLVVCRAGATTLCEVMAVGRPAIVIPYPHAAENHQEANAASLVHAGGAVRLADSEVVERLEKCVLELLSDEPRRLAMAEASRQLGRPEATLAVLQCVAETLRRA